MTAPVKLAEKEFQDGIRANRKKKEKVISENSLPKEKISYDEKDEPIYCSL